MVDPIKKHRKIIGFNGSMITTMVMLTLKTSNFGRWKSFQNFSFVTYMNNSGPQWDMITAVCSTIEKLPILEEKPKLTDLIHSAIQYCFNIFYQHSNFLFRNAHKILQLQICCSMWALFCFGHLEKLRGSLWKSVEQ